MVADTAAFAGCVDNSRSPEQQNILATFRQNLVQAGLCPVDPLAPDVVANGPGYVQSYLNSSRAPVRRKGREIQGQVSLICDGSNAFVSCLVCSYNRYDDATLLRFLRARKFDLTAAQAMWKTNEEWRKSYGTDQIRQFVSSPFPLSLSNM